MQRQSLQEIRVTKNRMNPCISSLNLTTRTQIEKEELHKLKNIWQSLYDHADSVQFRVPVDWEAYGLLDYPSIVKNPMDLGTVQTKLNNGQYLYVQDMIDDIQLIWDNCKLYNSPGSWIYNLAQKLEKNFKKMLKNYLPTIPFSLGGIKIFPSQLAPPKSKAASKKTKEKSQAVEVYNEDNDQEKITHNDKINLSDKLKNLSQTNLGLVVQKIIHSCPTAFSQLDSQRVQILLENIDAIAFRQLETFVNDLEDQEKMIGNKKIKTN